MMDESSGSCQVTNRFKFTPTVYVCKCGEYSIEVERDSELGYWEFSITGPNGYFVAGQASSKHSCFMRVIQLVNMLEELPYQ